MSRERKGEGKAKVDITQTDELGLTGAGKKVNLAAWVLSGVVIIAGIIALIATGQKIFILFIVLGIVTPLNVLAYDNLILKPKIARLKAERARESESGSRETGREPAVADGEQEADK